MNSRGDEESSNLGDLSMTELFRMEVENQGHVLSEGLLALENDPGQTEEIAAMMRAAHSLKGAARIIGIDPAVAIAHAMEDCLVAAQDGKLILTAAMIDRLLAGVDDLIRIAQTPDDQLNDWLIANSGALNQTAGSIAELMAGPLATTSLQEPQPLPQPTRPTPGDAKPQMKRSEPILPEVLLSKIRPGSLRDVGVLTIFRQETEIHAATIKEGLLAEENNPDPKAIETLLKCVRSIKGAATIARVPPAVRLARSLEDTLVEIGKGRFEMSSPTVDAMLRIVELLTRITDQSGSDTFHEWLLTCEALFDRATHELTESLTFAVQPKSPESPSAPAAAPAKVVAPPPPELQTPIAAKTAEPPELKPTDSAIARSSGRPQLAPAAARKTAARSASKAATKATVAEKSGFEGKDRIVRVTSESMDRLMGLAGESLVEARRLRPFADSLQKLKLSQSRLWEMLNRLRGHADDMPSEVASLLNDARSQCKETREILADRMDEFEGYARRADMMTGRLYREVIASRMRPFGDGATGFPRMVRDLARKLEKKVRFELVGENAQVDRDILEKLEAPLNHILRNAVDHGIDMPAERIAAGKPEVGVIRLEARHQAGMFMIIVSDDGRGVDPERVRRRVVERNMVAADMAAHLSEDELMDFMFLPGFSTAEKVTEISGRGVGLDVVHDMLREVGGSVRAVSTLGKGTAFHLQLPITLSVMRAVLVDIADEVYAFPTTRIDRILMVSPDDVKVMEGRRYVESEGESIGLVSARSVLELEAAPESTAAMCVVVISDRNLHYGIIVDRFSGERELVVRPLDRRLGKVPDINSAALIEDGSPLLIIDVDDMVRSIDTLLNEGRLKASRQASVVRAVTKKRVLVVDDSITVREVQRKLLENNGYEVEVAVDGMDGWHSLTSGKFDLVVSDVDMPRMNGIEFVTQMKADPAYKHLPVMIVSYKDREEDRMRGLKAGANFYLTKSSFHDNTFLESVHELIGPAQDGA